MLYHKTLPTTLGLVLLALAPTVASAQSSVWTAWGDNLNGQFGNGATTSSLLPIPVTALSDMVSISGGLRHSIGIKSDGTVWTWGGNERGQLGNGTYIDNIVPLKVPALTGAFTAVSAGRYSCLALKSDGTVWAWGWRLANEGTLESRSTPVQIPGLTGAIAISQGYLHSLALMPDGTVKSWGYAFYNELGLGPENWLITEPVTIPGLNNVIAIKTGIFSSVVLKSDGKVWTFGYNEYGQLGNGSPEGWPNTPPGEVSQLSDVTAIAVGNFHTLALKSDGSVWAWGLGTSGQLGNGAYLSSNLPVRVTSLATVTSIAALGDHNLAIKSDSTVYAWGRNLQGELGNGTTGYSSVPVQVSWLTNASSISGTNYSSLAQSGNSAELAVNGLIGTLQDAHLTVNSGQMNSLLTKLRNAQLRLASRNRSGAISMLQAFTAELASLVSTGVITSASAAPLIAAANAIIAMV